MTVKKPRSKSATIHATYETDLGLVLNWLRLNKAISSSGAPYETKNGGYAVRVRGKVSKSAIVDLVKDRFGIFAKVT